jgi:hypothetical protein
MIDLKLLPVALYREPSQRLQFRGAQASCVECRKRIVHFVERAHAGWSKTHHRGECGLRQCPVLPGLFAELSEAARFIEHIIRDLKGEPHASAVGTKGAQVFFRAASGQCANTGSGSNQSTGLGPVQKLEVIESDRAAFGSKIEHLSAYHP